MELDPVDRALVRELQVDGRASYEFLAGRVGLSRVSARARVRRLVDSGAMHVAAVVHPSARGLFALAHLSVHVERDTVGVAERIAAMPQMPLVSVVAGERAVIAEVRTEDMLQLRATVAEVRALPGVHGVTTVPYSRGVKDVYSPGGLIGPRNGVALDRLDHHLIEVLQADGRIPFARLGRITNTSASSARMRVLALLNAGILHIGAIITPGMLGLGSMCGFGLVLDPATGATGRIAEQDDVYYLTETIGQWDAVGTLFCTSPAAVSEALDRIRDVPGVRGLEAWMHLRVVKEDYSLPDLPAARSPGS
ncbi:MAG: Lrp/AsnC family transcriptional regulator [Streptosporangiales bacterium]